MSDTTTPTALRVKKFLANFFAEYIRENKFSPYMGTEEENNSVIVIKEGKQVINIPLVTKLRQKGVAGSSTLDGNEEQISSYAFEVTPTYRRNAVRVDKEEGDKPAFSYMKAARTLLANWAKELIRDDVIEALGAIIAGSTYLTYGNTTLAGTTEATGANKDTWLTNNNDRILYGAAKNNTVAGNHTSSLSAINTTDDKFTPGMGSLAKRMAKQATPKIRPIKVDKGGEWFVCFMDSYAFRDLKNDSTMTQANREAMERGKNNPLFVDGDLMHDGVIYKEIEEIADFIDGDSGTNGVWGGLASADGLNTAGNGSSRVGVSFLCGQQAVGYGLGQRVDMVVDMEKDYKFKPGVAAELKHQIRKAFFNSKQHGVVTIFSSSARDS